MIGAIVGGALNVGGQIFGGIKAAQSRKKYRQALEDRERENQAWYERRYNEDATARADAQRMMTLVGDAVRDRNRAAAGRAAVMGGTPEATAAVQEANNELIVDTAAQIMQSADARREAVEGQYMERRDQIRQAQDNLELDRGNQIASATRSVGATAGNIAQSIAGYSDAKEELKNEEENKSATA